MTTFIPRAKNFAKPVLLLAALSFLPLRSAAQSAIGQLGGSAPAAADTLFPPQASAPQPAAAQPAKYSHLDPDKIVPEDLLAAALRYYDANFKKIKNTGYLSVIDFSRHATVRRFFIVDMKTGAVEAMRVAHGFGSDPDYDGLATEFGNKKNSRMSSLGFYRTAEVYSGMFGRSMRLDGLSATNSNARERAVVVHGYGPVMDTGNNVGFSEGCPAVSPANINKVIDSLKGGSIIYAGLSAD